MKHKRQHSNGVVSKEERTNRIRQLLGSPTAMRLQEPEKPASDVIKTDDESSNEEKFVVKKEANKISKSKKRVERLRFDQPILASLNVSQEPFIPSAEVVPRFEDVSRQKDPNLIQIDSGISEINYFDTDNPESVENVPLQFENPSQDFLLNPNPTEALISDQNSCFEDQANAAASAGYSNFPSFDSQCVNDPYQHQQLPQSSYQQYHYEHQQTCDLSSEQQQHQYYYAQGYDYSDYYQTNWQFSSEHQMQSSDLATANQYPYQTVAFE